MLTKIKENILVLPASILIAAIFVLIALKEGFIPYISFPSLGLSYSMMGTSKILSREMSLTITQVLYPGGLQLREFILPHFLMALINKFSNSLVFTAGLFYFITYVASVTSLMIIFRKITKNYFISAFLAAIFFVDPYFTSQAGIPTIHVAMMFMPVSLLFDLFVFEKGSLVKKEHFIFVIILGYFARILITLTSAYLAVILAISSCLFFLIYYVTSLGRKFFKSRELKLYLILIVIPWVLALLTMKLLMAQNTSSFTSPLGMLRACSPDLLTILLPSNDLLLSKIFSVSDYLTAHGRMFPGDASMWQNYFGFTLIISTIWIVYKKGLKNKLVLSLLTVGMVILFLGLGPSLKFNSTIVATKGITGQNYSLSNQQVVTDFPWANLYKVFPLNIMRAVYRWLVVPKFLLLVGLAFTLRQALNHRRVLLCVLLILLAMLEVTPKHMNLTAGMSKFSQIQKFKHDVIYPLESNGFKSTDRVIFLPSENDFLVPYMAAKTDFTTYNGAGDKAINTARNSYPQLVQQILTARDPKKIGELILQIQEKGLAEYVILTFFNPRWDSYKWPVSNNTYNTLKNRALKIEAEIGPNAKVAHYKYFDVINLENFKVKNKHSAEKEKSRGI